MATRRTISRICQRIDDLAERLAPSPGPIVIFRTLGEDPALRAAEIDRSGQRRVIVINTGIEGSAPDPAYCTRESVAAALPEAKAMIAGQRELAERDTHNDFGGFAERMEEHWLALCRRFDIDYGVSPMPS